MSVYVSKEVAKGLEQARRAKLAKKSRLRVQIGEDVYPILRFSEKNFAIDAENAPHMRGLVDIYDGARHLYQALIVATSFDGHAMVYEFKRNTVASDKAPLDFEREEDAPVALIPLH